jgi:ferric-dicitrate binding protein FerR (iron transport regulator)
MTPSEDQVRNAIAQQAADFFVASQAGSLDANEREKFSAWLRESPVHIEEYLGIVAVARDLPDAVAGSGVRLDELTAAARAAGDDNVMPFSTLAARAPTAERRSGRVSVRAIGFPLAVAAALLVGIAALWVERDNWLGLATTYQTARSERTLRPLPDGSSVELNAASTVVVRYGPTERGADVTHGRALFTVAHGSPRPFRVTAGAATVVAVGTQFDVDRRGAATIVTVVEGRVLVSASASGLGADAARTVSVGAGEQVRVDAGSLPAAVARVDLGRAEAWRHGKIVFDRRPLGEVADEFNRYAAVPFEIADPALRALEISGVFDGADSDSFARFLASLDGVVVERTAERVRVSRAQRSADAVPAAR